MDLKKSIKMGLLTGILFGIMVGFFSGTLFHDKIKGRALHFGFITGSTIVFMNIDLLFAYSYFISSINIHETAFSLGKKLSYIG
jgi:hypothetical protein